MSASQQLLLGGKQVAANYIEDVFSTYLYTGTGAAQTINNGIDLAGKGGLIWIKSRNNSTFADSPNVLTDSVTGFSKYLISSQTTQQQNWATDAPVPSSTGFSLQPNGLAPYTNYLTGSTYASWTFRKQPKFFDVVTYTGTGTIQTIAHNLGSAPGCIIVKKTSGVSNWAVYHRSTGNTEFMSLNLTNASATLNFWGDTDPTSTQFTVNGYQAVGDLGGTYVAYLFAHNAGGFGATGTDNVISCGSFTTSAAQGATVSLGYEPQWLLVKNSSGTGGWQLFDNMRGLSTTNAVVLQANLSNAETDYQASPSYIAPTATGFTISDYGIFNASSTYIYIAIRRGPMKVPTDGTKVFDVQSLGNNTSGTLGLQVSQPSDMVMSRYGRSVTGSTSVASRLTGYGVQQYNLSTTNTPTLITSSTSAEARNGFIGIDGGNFLTTWLASSADGGMVSYFMRRAPGFFDEVCYTGTGVARTVTHNLGVAPELMIVKNRVASNGWITYCSYMPAPLDNYIYVNSDGAKSTVSGVWKTPTATTWGMDISFSEMNTNGSNYVSYLFATCAGVSKVGSYTGTGTTQVINCGFTAGSRFVLIKCTDAVGSWYVWDSARGIVAGNDPHLSLNTTVAEVTSNDSVDPISTGFIVNQVAATNINVTGASYIFFAVA